MNKLIIAAIVLVIIVLVIYMYKKNLPGAKYIGCYKDGGWEDRAFSGKYRMDTDFETCAEVARNTGSKYMGYQGEPGAKVGTCWYGNSYDKHGKAADCVTKDAAGNIMGQWDIAVYEIN
jgi:hypothetical protein